MRVAVQPKEWQIHSYVADLLAVRAKNRVLWFHVPNEGQRAPKTGAFLKRLGMLPGVSDFVIVIEGLAYFLEIKTTTGRRSSQQIVFAQSAREAGAGYAVANTPEAAELVLDGWGALKPGRKIA